MDWTYTVRPGDTLWGISQQYLKDVSYWRRLQVLNDVRDPEHIPPGRPLQIPLSWLKIQPVPARVVSTAGQAEAYLTAQGKNVRLRSDMLLYAGDALITGSDGSATVEFADGSRILLGAKSRMVMDAMSAFGNRGMVDTRVRLENGRSDSRASPDRDPDSRYQIWTPAGISAVRGTEFRVSVEDGGEIARTEVMDGRVRVSGKGRTVVLDKGFGTLVRVGERPKPPVSLLPAPALASLPSVFERVPIRFRLEPVKGAKAYRLEIAPDRQFETLLFQKTFSTASLTGPDLPDGTYVLRVRAIDAQGLEGLDGYREFVLNARPEPPFLIDPVDEAIIRGEAPAFRWSAPQDAVSYHFQLAAGDNFDAPIVDRSRNDEPRLDLNEPLEPGFYRWRVATRDSTGEQGPFSDPQRFEWRHLPPVPVPEAPEMGEESVVFRWRKELPGQKYQFQLARDPQFENVIVDQVLAEPEVTVGRPVPATYYMRIRTIDVDGFEGPYGQTQQIDISATSYWPMIIFPFLFALFFI